MAQAVAVMAGGGRVGRGSRSLGQPLNALNLAACFGSARFCFGGPSFGVQLGDLAPVPSRLETATFGDDTVVAGEVLMVLSVDGVEMVVPPRPPHRP